MDSEKTLFSASVNSLRGLSGSTAAVRQQKVLMVSCTWSVLECNDDRLTLLHHMYLVLFSCK